MTSSLKYALIHAELLHYFRSYAKNNRTAVIIHNRKYVIAVGIVIVDICSGNAITTIDIESILESEFPEVAVLINDCLSYCGLCAIRPYALVNGKRVIGKTVEECLNNIRVAIKEELAVYQ